MASAKTTAKKAAPKANSRKAKGSAPEAKSFRNTLVVVESPAKAKTIKKYLGSGYTVKASVGHIMDLPKSKMGVDIENGFEPVYEVIKGKQRWSPSSGPPPRTPTACCSPPTPTAKAKPSPGT